MKRQNSGFTLIELVIVIVILGILSAFALPRFADLGGDARAASLEGAAGAIKSSTSITRSACLVSSDCNESAETGESINLEGATINLQFGYPAAETSTGDTGGIAVAAQLSDDDYQIAQDGDNVVVSFEDTEAGSCQLTYTQPQSDSAPTTTVDDSGC